MDSETERLEIKFEEYAWSTMTVLKNPGIVCYAILVCMQRRGARRYIGCWDNVEEVLICDKS
jgi:hypothetical protein